jgi:N-ethylmaleimide reductase
MRSAAGSTSSSGIAGESRILTSSQAASADRASAIAASGQLHTPKGRLARLPDPAPAGAARDRAANRGFRSRCRQCQTRRLRWRRAARRVWLPAQQFLKDGTNTRIDVYGGKVGNRARFVLEVVESIVGTWGAERVGVKLSPSSTFYGQSDSDPLGTYRYVANALDGLGIGYIT